MITGSWCSVCEEEAKSQGGANSKWWWSGALFTYPKDFLVNSDKEKYQYFPKERGLRKKIARSMSASFRITHRNGLKINVLYSFVKTRKLFGSMIFVKRKKKMKFSKNTSKICYG